MREHGPKTVSLIGMPGAGKSTVGILLAKRLGLDFVDTDVSIQVREGRSLADIVSEDGYRALRRVEEAALLDLQPQGCVVATGGSAVYSEGAMTHLRAHGPVIFLDVSVPTLRERVPDASARGIAGPAGQTLAQVAAERVPLYRHHADIVVDADARDMESVIRAVVAGLEADGHATR